MINLRCVCGRRYNRKAEQNSSEGILYYSVDEIRRVLAAAEVAELITESFVEIHSYVCVE